MAKRYQVLAAMSSNIDGRIHLSVVQSLIKSVSMNGCAQARSVLREAISSLIAVVMFLLFCSPNLAIAQSDTFDIPFDKQVVDYGPSPYQPGGNVRIRLSCYFYTNFMIKEFDLGQEGAEWWSISPVASGTKAPCKPSHAPNDKIIGPTEWTGYFKGVSRNLVFLDAADSANGGMEFAIYDARTGRKIFDDSYYDKRMWKKEAGNSPFDRLRVRHGSSDQTVLVYLRVAETDCDLHLDKASCWQHVRKQFGVKSAVAPGCSGYTGITAHEDSAVAYPVEVSLSPKPITKATEGPVKCWPVD